jgi:hypothetical protein
LKTYNGELGGRKRKERKKKSNKEKLTTTNTSIISIYKCPPPQTYKHTNFYFGRNTQSQVKSEGVVMSVKWSSICTSADGV